MQKLALHIFSPWYDLKLYSFIPLFIDEETRIQGAWMDISFKNAFNYILSIAQYFYFLTCMKLNELKSYRMIYNSDNEKSQEIDNTEKHVEAKGIIKYDIWYLNMVSYFFLLILFFSAYTPLIESYWTFKEQT